MPHVASQVIKVLFFPMELRLYLKRYLLVGLGERWGFVFPCILFLTKATNFVPCRRKIRNKNVSTRNQT